METESGSRPVSAAFAARHGTQFPHHPSVFCRQKQYNGVASCLGFLHPFLATAASAPSQQGEADDEALVHDLYPQLIAAPASLNHEGPLALRHVTALQSVTNEQVLAFFCAFRWVPASLRAAVDTGTDLFPEPSPLMRQLWDPKTTLAERFAAAIRAARADKPKYYRELSREGYLCEPGLHAQRVFAPSLCAQSASSAATDADNHDAHTTPSAPLDLPPAGLTARQELHWSKLIDAYSLSLPDRSHIHELENLPQEIAIGELLAEVAGEAIPPSSPTSCDDEASGSAAIHGYFARGPSRVFDCVVDVGGGNAFLVAEVGERLGCDGLVIDPHYPPHSVDCCPRMWPDTAVRVRAPRPRRFALHRKIALFKEVDFRKDIPACPARCAFIAKHLCGTAVDECLSHLDAQNCWPRVLILVPCCFHKGQFSAYVNQPYLRDVMHIHSQEAYTRMTKLTDWSRSIYQMEELENSDSSATTPVGEDVSRKRKRKSHHKAHTMDYLVHSQEAMAASVEALLNRGRMLWLQAHGYDVRLLQYVPDFVTPKNKCIVAVRREHSEPSSNAC